MRSVGYAELFSLSREDVLAAMKDYPEAEVRSIASARCRTAAMFYSIAQEILLSLGRKRLVEARKAASQHKAALARKGLLALERQAQMRPQQDDAATPASAEGCSGGQSAASKLTERLRSDVYGLKKAIRKSFKDSRRYSFPPLDGANFFKQPYSWPRLKTWFHNEIRRSISSELVITLSLTSHCRRARSYFTQLNCQAPFSPVAA